MLLYIQKRLIATTSLNVNEISFDRLIVLFYWKDMKKVEVEKANNLSLCHFVKGTTR